MLGVDAIEAAAMRDWSPLEDDVFLKGTLTVFVHLRSGRAFVGQRVFFRGCDVV